MIAGGWRVRGIGTTIAIRLPRHPGDSSTPGALDSLLFRLTSPTEETQHVIRQVLRALDMGSLLRSRWAEDSVAR